jgi:hypothetical protein
MRVIGDLDFMRAHEKSAVKARSHVGIGSLDNLDSAILQTQHSFFCTQDGNDIADFRVSMQFYCLLSLTKLKFTVPPVVYVPGMGLHVTTTTIQFSSEETWRIYLIASQNRSKYFHFLEQSTFHAVERRRSSSCCHQAHCTCTFPRP